MTRQKLWMQGIFVLRGEIVRPVLQNRKGIMRESAHGGKVKYSAAENMCYNGR